MHEFIVFFFLMGWPIVWHLPVLILFRCFTVSTIDFFFCNFVL